MNEALRWHLALSRFCGLRAGAETMPLLSHSWPMCLSGCRTRRTNRQKRVATSRRHRPASPRPQPTRQTRFSTFRSGFATFFCRGVTLLRRFATFFCHGVTLLRRFATFFCHGVTLLRRFATFFCHGVTLLRRFATFFCRGVTLLRRFATFFCRGVTFRNALFRFESASGARKSAKSACFPLIAPSRSGGGGRPRPRPRATRHAGRAGLPFA